MAKSNGNGNGKRQCTSLSIKGIDKPQIAEELTWQHRARRAIQRRLTSGKLEEYADSVLERAKNGDHKACDQLDRWMGVGVPITINVAAGDEGTPAAPPALEDQIEDLLYETSEQLSTSVIAARLQVPDSEVRRAVNTHLGSRFVLEGGGVVTLA
jgi:hypothetical protein